MVANYTIGKKKYKAQESQMRKILSSTENLRKRLLELADLDTCAYIKFCGSKGRKRDKALKETKRIPRQIIKCCQRGFKLSSILVKRGNVNLIGDVKAARTLLGAAQKAAREFC
jgi:formiminotetrahydrofolate cyclodeaminase